MKELLKKLTFARTMILICLLASLVLGWQIWGNQQRITKQSRELEPGGRVVELVQDIQAYSQRYTQLFDSKSSELLKGEQTPATYISAIAIDRKVSLGQVNVTPGESEVSKNIVDRTYRILPSEAGDVFTRNQIANFLYKLETDSRRVRVTEVTLEALNADGKPRIDPEEYPTDSWKWQVTVTSRQRKDGAEPGS